MGWPYVGARFGATVQDLEMSFFKPEDISRFLKVVSQQRPTFGEWIDFFNSIVQERGVRVYARVGSNASDHAWIANKRNEDTHQAFLICIEELQKKECEHVVASQRQGDGPWTLAPLACGRCGVYLKPPAKWEVAND